MRDEEVTSDFQITTDHIVAAATSARIDVVGFLFLLADRSSSQSDKSPPVGLDSPLLRWLRVNDCLVPIPDRGGVFRSLEHQEQEMLLRRHVVACVPLVYERQLVAWLALTAPKYTSEVRLHAASLEGRRHQWAQQLHAARLQQSREVRGEALRKSNRLVVAGQVAAGIAHEVKNPLCAIRSMVQLIKDGDAAPEEHEALLTTVIADIDRIDHVLSAMFQLGQQRPVMRERCDLTAIATDSVRFCGAYANSRGLRLALVADGPAHLSGDPRQLKQVLVNVILNSCQATNSGGTIEVKTAIEESASGPLVAVVVSDAGYGMSQDVLDRVFEPFYTTKADGGGLGLFVCREIVENHGGQIRIQSEVSVGTSVTICLPCRPA